MLGLFRYEKKTSHHALITCLAIVCKQHLCLYITSFVLKQKIGAISDKNIDMQHILY
jgi:hypothetical protein